MDDPTGRGSSLPVLLKHLGDGVQIPQLHRFPFLGVYETVDFGVSRHHYGSTQQTRPEYGSISANSNSQT